MRATHHIPAELETAPPRRVRRRPGTRSRVYGQWIWLGILTAGGLVILALRAPEPWLLALTPPQRAAVKFVSRSGLPKTGRRKSQITYEVVFLYHPNGARDADVAIKDSDSITAAEYDALSGRGSVMIHAAQLGPLRWATIHRTPWQYLRARALDWCVAIAWNALTFTAIYCGWRRHGQTRKLLREGQPVAGRITAVRRDRDKSSAYMIDYEYPLPNTMLPSPQRGSLAIGKRDFQRASEGQPIVVLCDPQDPARHLVYDFCDYCVKG
jgi:hypothetical protein